MLKSNGFVPEEVDLLKEAAALEAEAAAASDRERKRRLAREANAVRLKLDLLREARKRSGGARR
jgi:hypothetical protein